MKLAALIALTLTCYAHEGMQKSSKPTKAQRDLDRSRKQLDAVKAKAAKQGRYLCCVKPACNLCARKHGSCNCARNVEAGKGACGECYGGWVAGRGAMKGRKRVPLLASDHQACGKTEISADLQAAIDALMGAKKTLVSEKRYACCIRGGCGQCAHEGQCECGRDLAAGGKGVCGECVDGWRSGHGAFPGIDPAEIQFAAASAPMILPMVTSPLGSWSVAATGQVFAVHSAQSGPRGRDKTFAPNWLMGTASRSLGPGTLTLRSMLSLDPATITSRRYPLLFATGETAFGIPIINGQHPHDFFMELAASYVVPLGERTTVSLYGGPRGEPALGPTAYPHRLSASENPMAVIAHHLQDSTHIATNVVTAGIAYGPVKWEVSGFRGREPDERRWGMEQGGIDSLSTRLTVKPAQGWSGQFSIGRLNKAEVTHPLRPVLRTTASVEYTRPMSKGHWATTAIWGRNHHLAYTQLPGLPVIPVSAIRTQSLRRPQHLVSVPTGIPGQIFNSYLIESTWRRGSNWIWGRTESADKDSTVLFEEEPFVLLVDEQRIGRVQAFTAGYERELPRTASWLSTGLGAQLTIFRAPANLAPIYGTHPAGIQVFLRLRLVSR